MIHICLISDSEYSKYMGATIVSILKNSNDVDNIVFHIIDTGIFEDDKNKLIQLKEIKDFEINFYKYDHSKYIEICKEKLKHKVHVTPSAFCKLEIHNIIPNLDKILYLDCDIIVNKSLFEFYNITFDNNYLIASLLPKNIEHLGKDLNAKLGIDSNKHKYFNSGVLLLNLKKFREDDIDNKFKEYFNSRESFIHLDQDAFNSACKYNIKYVSDAYNFQPRVGFYKIIPDIDDVFALHYSGKEKPWGNECKTIYFYEEYWKYFCLTPWFKENPGGYIETMIQQRINNLDIENRFNIENERLIKLESENKVLSDKINKLINTLSWFIPIRKWRDNFRKKVLADQTRPDQTRPDQTRPISICIDYICFYNNSKYKKIQPMLQPKMAA